MSCALTVAGRARLGAEFSEMMATGRWECVGYDDQWHVLDDSTGELLATWWGPPPPEWHTPNESVQELAHDD